MRRANFTVFDEYVAPSSPAQAFYTSQEFNAKLGQFDQVAIQVVLDNATGIGALSLWVEHSADGINFVAITDQSTDSDVAVAVAATATTSAWGPAPTTSLLAYVRIKGVFSSTTGGGHVRIHVTQRDQG